MQNKSRFIFIFEAHLIFGEIRKRHVGGTDGTAVRRYFWKIEIRGRRGIYMYTYITYYINYNLYNK